MRLDAWLKQPHSPADRLRLVERLAQALNAVHDRGETLASLAPDRVEVGSDMKVELEGAQHGRAEPGYAAPEVLEGGPPSTAADIYGAGALCWEILAGRPCGEAPRPLPEVVPDLPRELANSVMGCLEKSPEWRPKDLTYLAQLAAAQQKVNRGPESQPQQQPQAQAAVSRAPQPPKAAPTPRAAPRRASRSHLPLFLAAILLIAAAAASYFWLNREAPAPQPTARGVPTPAPTATPEPAATATPAAVATPPPAHVAVVATPTPPPAPVKPVAAAEPEPTPVATPTPTPPPAVAAAPEATPPPAVVEPASLTTLSPLSVKRGGRVLLDIRGAGLRADQHVAVLPLKDAPRGISVVRQKWTSASLVTVLLELDANVSPAVYAIALESANGDRTNPLHFTVTK